MSPPGAVRILGIDPGSQVTGWGLIELRGTDLACVAYGVLDLSADRPLHERLVALADGLAELFERLDPDEVSVEDLYVHRNVRAALTLGHARGVILLAAARRGLDPAEYPANTVKQAVLGQGGRSATKERVAFMVRAILGLAETPEPADITDALACAICHAHKRDLPT
ncbi:MAG: crossover junction endodeoxyribonuclease RuvC [bacterium]